MSFRFTISPSLAKRLDKLAHRDRALAVAVRKKIVQIKSSDSAFLDHFKNLRGPLKEYKRVHVGGFVLLFKVEEDTIIFDRLLSHDEAY